MKAFEKIRGIEINLRMSDIEQVSGNLCIGEYDGEKYVMLSKTGKEHLCAMTHEKYNPWGMHYLLVVR